jgi:predicted dehydrogenase
MPLNVARGAAEVLDPFADAAGNLRIGLVGCGDIAAHNAAAVNAAPNARLVACYDPVHELAAELAERYEMDAVPTAEALLERRDVDAVFLSVPHHLHSPLVAEAARAGKHVIVEKPPANNLASAVEMVAAAKRHGVVLSICFPHRYGANAIEAHRLIRAGAVGEVAGTRINFVSDKPASYWLGGFSGRTVSSWRGSRADAGGGVLIMNVSHLIDLLRHLTGAEAETCTAFTRVIDGPAEVEDAISLSVMYANGAIGTVFASSALRGHRAGSIDLDVWGADGFLAVEPRLHVYTLRAVDGVRPVRWQATERVPSVDIRAVYVSRVATAIARGEEPDVSPADALAVQALIEAAYRSGELGGVPVRPADLLREAGA